MKKNTALTLGLGLFMALGAVLPASAGTTAATTTPPAAPAKVATAQKAPYKASHFYISLKSKGPGCEVVEMKPSTKLMVGKHFYRTEADAQKALQSAKACRA